MRDPIAPRSIDRPEPRTCFCPVSVGTCGAPVPPDAPLPMCLRHLSQAWEFCRDWISREAEQRHQTFVAETSQRIVEAFAEAQEATDADRAALLADPEIDDPDSVVYYLRFADRIKIGFSRNLGSRLLAIPHDELLAVEPGARLVEARRHAQFAEHRIIGEWFAASPELLAHIDEVKAREAGRGEGRRKMADAFALCDPNGARVLTVDDQRELLGL